MASTSASVHPASAATPTPIRAILAPLLPAGTYVPVRVERVDGGILAAYDPTANTRADVWQLLRRVFGDLLDITPASVTA